MIPSWRTTKNLWRHAIGSNPSLVCVIWLFVWKSLFTAFLVIWYCWYLKQDRRLYCSCTVLFSTDIGWRSYIRHPTWRLSWCSCVPSGCNSDQLSCHRQVWLSKYFSMSVFFPHIVWVYVIKGLVLFVFIKFILPIQNEALKRDLKDFFLDS